MSLWHKLLNRNTHQNSNKNHTVYVENDCLCKTNEQLILKLKTAHSDCVIKAVKRVLASRGFSRKELEDIQQQHTIH